MSLGKGSDTKLTWYLRNSREGHGMLRETSVIPDVPVVGCLLTYVMGLDLDNEAYWPDSKSKGMLSDYSIS